MFVPLWLIVVNLFALLVLAGMALRARAGGDMIEQQRRATPPPAPHAQPGATADETALLARPDIADALRRGRKIEAIRLIRAETGKGLKETKQLVDRRG